MKFLLYAAILLLLCASAGAQEISFKDTVSHYNMQRIRTNTTGMKVLGGWGIANIAAGGIGYFSATKNEWKYFHGMNAAWGLMNTISATALRSRTRREKHATLSADQAYSLYRFDKRHYLIGACLDVVYIAGGVTLIKVADNTTDNTALYNGFGKSIVVQGVFLLLFDNVMYASHLKNNSRWYTIMNEIHLTGRGIGFVHTF